MGSIWKKINDLFKQAEESSPTQPLIHELIERSAEEKEDYDFWKTTLVCERLSSWLLKQYGVYQALPDDVDEMLYFLDTPSSKGFAIQLNKTGYSERDVVHFFDYLKEMALRLDYHTQISDRRVFVRKNWVEKIEKHYLKPKPSFLRTDKFKQGFGNILIELVFRDNQPYQLKFSATVYQDRLYEDAKAFEELMELVLNK